jgi:capsular polysaccharide biosynthesis protein
VEVPIRDIAVILGRHAARASKRLATLLPDATIHRVAARTPSDGIAALARLPQPQLIVDATKAQNPRKRRRAKRLSGFLPPGGAYAFRKRPNGQVVVRRQEQEYRYKIREAEANALLDARFGSRWGRVLAVRPAETYTSPVELTVHGTRATWPADRPEPKSHLRIDVPELCVREYVDVTCWSHQRVALENYWLPDTFRHHQHRRLAHRALVHEGLVFGGLAADVSRDARVLDGQYYYFDSEYPLHYGHFLTEVLARFWGWQEAVRVAPDVRPLVSLPMGRDAIPSYQRDAYAAFGVDVSNVTYIPPNECVRVQSLFAATPAFVMPHYASPGLRDVWLGLARTLKRAGDTPRRLFVGRRVRDIRSCLNSDEVEAFFTDLGFSVVYPEDHDFADQVTMFANADVIAGFAGSGLFTMMFASDKTVIVICPDTYTATNEFLIASLMGGRLYYFLADAEVKHVPGKWTKAAYQSNFRFDVQRYAAEIRAAVDEAGS